LPLTMARDTVCPASIIAPATFDHRWKTVLLVGIAHLPKPQVTRGFTGAPSALRRVDPAENGPRPVEKEDRGCRFRAAHDPCGVTR